MAEPATDYENMSLGRLDRLAQQGDGQASRVLTDLNKKVLGMARTFAEAPAAIASDFAARQREQEERMQRVISEAAAEPEAKERRQERREWMMLAATATSCLVAVAALVVSLVS